MEPPSKSTPLPAASVNPPVRLERAWRFRCPTALRFAIAVSLVALALVTTSALRSSVDAPSFQTPFFFCAIVLSSWIGGAGPGLASTLLSIFVIEYAFTEPRFTLGFTGSEVPKFTVFFLTGAFISWLAGRQRADEEALLVARESLEEKVWLRTQDLSQANLQLTGEVAERTRAENELKRLNRAWRVRGLLNRSVARSSHEHELLSRVCQVLQKSGEYPLAWIAFPANGEIVREAHAGATGLDDPERAWLPGSCGYDLALRAIESGLPQTCTSRNPGLPPDAWATRHQIKSILALPLLPDDQAVGSLLVYSDDLDAFDEKETELLQQAANDVAQGLALFRTRAARAQAEQALEKTQAELARVSRLTTMGELTASIAHEINQPLAAVVTNANACLRWLDREPPNIDEGREAARRIIRDGKRGSEVIARIRSMLKKEEMQRSAFNMEDVIREILVLMHNAMDTVRVETHFAADIPSVWGDRVLVQQVVLNLILNANDAMASVAARDKVLRIETGLNAASQIEVAVRDNGIGLPPDRLEKIFDTFFTTKANGLGMGLAICRSIVEQHGGRLWAEANPNGGATFRFTLSVEKEAA